MKVELWAGGETGAVRTLSRKTVIAELWGETDRLTDVLLCPPSHLAPIPCCSVTRQSLENGFKVSPDVALRQHAALVTALELHGVRCHMLDPNPGLPDMCFTRDVAVSTPFGLVALNPAMPHRRAEVDALIDACARWSIPVRRIGNGTIEGGDIAVARPGLLIVGTSGERTSQAGIADFATPFRDADWDVLICPFATEHLHLDTIFCMIDRDHALACVELLDPDFLLELEQRGIEVIPVGMEDVGNLGCNILSLGDARILASAASPAISALLRERGYRVTLLDISQFASCGGGLHCLTMPLRRISAASPPFMERY